LSNPAFSEKVDDHLTASAMMADDHQGLILREVVGAVRNLRHRHMQSAVQSANSKLSRFTDIENRMLLPCASHVCELANRDRIGSTERFCGHSEVLLMTYTYAVYTGPEVGQETLPRRTASATMSIAIPNLTFRNDAPRG
jgi:hypothetical protein